MTTAIVPGISGYRQRIRTPNRCAPEHLHPTADALAASVKSFRRRIPPAGYRAGRRTSTTLQPEPQPATSSDFGELSRAVESSRGQSNRVRRGPFGRRGLSLRHARFSGRDARSSGRDPPFSGRDTRSSPWHARLSGRDAILRSRHSIFPSASDCPVEATISRSRRPIFRSRRSVSRSRRSVSQSRVRPSGRETRFPGRDA